jgi:competence protein ComEC
VSALGAAAQARESGDGLRRPPDLRLVPAALAVWAAVLLGLWLGPSGGLAAAVLAGTGWVVARRPGRRWLVAGAVATAGCAGAAGLLVSAHALLVAGHPLQAGAERGAAATVRVVVRDDPRPVRGPAYGSRPAGAAQVLVAAELRRAEVGGASWSVGGRVLLLAPVEGWSRLLPGQSLTAQGLLAPPQRRDLTVAVLRVPGAPRDVGPPPWWQTAAGGLRDGLREAATVLPEAQAGLMPGLAVGDTRGLTAEVEEDFRAAGLTHLTAVSGANLAIVGGAVLGLLRLLRADPRLAAGLSAAAVLGFVVLARPSPSVVRAAAMGAVVLLALALGRARSAVPALAASVLVLLFTDPALATDPGFALSVLATGALVLVAPNWVAALRRRGVPPGVAEAVVIPAAACLVTAPLVAGLSGQVSLVAVVANLLAAPAVAPATVLGVLAAVTSAVAPPLAQTCAWAAGPAVWWLVAVADRSAAVPGAVLDWPAGAAGAVLLVAVVLVLLVLGRSPRSRAVLAAVVLGLLLVFVPTRFVPVGWPPAGWVLVACDVGQGDAVVVATGRPGQAVLVDAGPADGPVDACLDRLGVRSLALVVLSHLHADHVGGLAGALRGRPASAVAVGPVGEPRWALAEVARQAAAAGAPLLRLGAGQRLGWPGLVLDVLGPLHPPADVDPEDGTAVNDGSLVLRATTPAGTALLTGDIELAAQADLLVAGAPLRADLLKMPHHGSRYSSAAFLSAVAPRAVLVSVGAGNSYRHPDPGLLDALGRAGAVVRRTDTGGDLALVTGATGAELVARGDPLPARRRRTGRAAGRIGYRSGGRRGGSATADSGGEGRSSAAGRDHGVWHGREAYPRVSRPRRNSSTGSRQRLAHRLAAGGDGGRRADLAGHRVEGLEAVAGDQQDGLGLGVELPGLDELLGRRHGDATGGLGEHALRAGEQADALDHFGVADVGDRPAGPAHRVEHVRAVRGVADRQRASDRVRAHGLDHVVALLEGLRHG